MPNVLSKSLGPLAAFIGSVAALILLGCPNPGSVPEAPSGLDGIAVSSTSISLTWHDASDDETGFRVERRTGSGSFHEVAALDAGSTAWTDGGLAASTAYTYRVFAFNRKGDSPASGTVTVATPAAPPTAPSGLTATAVSTSQIDLSWTDTSADETGFRIQRSPDGGTWSNLTTLGVNANYYSHTGLTPGQTNYYRVCATSGSGDSEYSSAANATTLALPAAPSDLTASPVSTTRIDLAWTDNASGETGFRIERRVNGGAWATLATPAPNAASYNDTGLSAGNTYAYKVCATNGAVDSSFSNTATVVFTVPAAPTGLTATVFSTTRIDLAWVDNSDNETGFEIERSSNGGGTWSPVTTTSVNATSYGDATGLVVGNTYTYRVHAGNGIGDSANSNAVVIALATPAAPAGLAATPFSATRIDLAWTDNANNETGFKIERRVNAGAWSQIGTAAANATTYVNGSGLSASNTYEYRVRSWNAVGDSTYSGTAAVDFRTPTAPSGLTATGGFDSRIDLSWTDNSSNETGFEIDRSVNGTSGWSLIFTTPANAVSYSNTGLPDGAKYYYRARATNPIGDSANSGTVNAATLPPSQAFKVANSWGKGFTGEKYPDGFYYITYAAFKGAQIYCLFMDDKPVAYNPTVLATFQITHPRRGDCYVQVGAGLHGSPVMIKTFNYAAWTRGDANPFPSNVMAVDITEFAPYLNTNNLFLKVYDATIADYGTVDTGTIQNFKVERYSGAYGGAHTTLSATGTPKATLDGDTVFVDLTTVGFFGSSAPTASAAPSRISSLLSSHAITGSELADLKQRVGVAEKARNYNVTFGRYGTGLRPPTEEEWDEIQRSARIVDSIGSDYAHLPPALDLSALNAFPPIGNQGSQGSCVAWSIGYYIKTFQEALERGWNLSTVKMIGSWPYYPDSQQNHILSPTWTYNQINGGGDNGASYTQAARLIFDLGTVTWQTTPYTVSDPWTWPSEAAYREAPWYRGVQPQSTEYGTVYSFVVDTDAEIGILKTLLANNVPVSISIDAGKYSALSADDLWDETSYPLPASTNHANTLVGYRD